MVSRLSLLDRVSLRTWCVGLVYWIVFIENVVRRLIALDCVCVNENVVRRLIVLDRVSLRTWYVGLVY